MTLSEEAIELYQSAILSFIKKVNGAIYLKTGECIVFESEPLSEKQLEELEPYGEVNIEKVISWKPLERYEVIFR